MTDDDVFRQLAHWFLCTGECTHLAHHELESIVVVIVVIIDNVTGTVVDIVIVITTGECVGIRLRWHSLRSGCTGNGQCHILAGDILADVLCLQSADYLPVAAPMHVVLQQRVTVASFHNLGCKTWCQFVMS